MASTQHGTDPWPQERDGYYRQTPVAYAPVPNHFNRSTKLKIIRKAEQVGSVVAGGGIIWTTYAVLHHSDDIIRFALFPPGPIEMLAIGVLIWLIAKWCRTSSRRS